MRCIYYLNTTNSTYFIFLFLCLDGFLLFAVVGFHFFLNERENVILSIKLFSLCTQWQCILIQTSGKLSALFLFRIYFQIFYSSVFAHNLVSISLKVSLINLSYLNCMVARGYIYVSTCIW